jgi:hypothetical protein
LQPYSFNVVHSPGATNQNADVVSRYPLASNEDSSGAHLDEEEDKPATMSKEGRVQNTQEIAETPITVLDEVVPSARFTILAPLPRAAPTRFDPRAWIPLRVSLQDVAKIVHTDPLGGYKTQTMQYAKQEKGNLRITRLNTYPVGSKFWRSRKEKST